MNVAIFISPFALKSVSYSIYDVAEQTAAVIVIIIRGFAVIHQCSIHGRSHPDFAGAAVDVDQTTQAIPPRVRPLWFALDDKDRQDLYRRIDRRVELMLEIGLMEEIRSLLDRGISKKSTAMQAIGYKEFVDALDGRCTIEEATALVQQSSRRYAKRQLTWFRRNNAIHWLVRQPHFGTAEILAQARQIIRDSDK